MVWRRWMKTPCMRNSSSCCPMLRCWAGTREEGSSRRHGVCHLHQHLHLRPVSDGSTLHSHWIVWKRVKVLSNISTNYRSTTPSSDTSPASLDNNHSLPAAPEPSVHKSTILMSHPNIFDLHYNNLYWQVLEMDNATFYLYGAYLGIHQKEHHLSLNFYYSFLHLLCFPYQFRFSSQEQRWPNTSYSGHGEQQVRWYPWLYYTSECLQESFAHILG